jgi:hypothetical protein
MNDGEGDGDGGINVRARHYLIARTAADCPHCRATTGLVALMVPPLHEVLSDTWECASRHAFLFYVDYLPEEVVRCLQSIAPTYRWAVSPATQGPQWANHCERCGAFQEDHDLHCEPEGAFLPVSPAAAANIDFFAMPCAFEASAAGYAMDPPFVDVEPGV